MNKPTITDLYIADRIAFEITENNVTIEQVHNDYDYDALFKCDAEMQKELIDKAVRGELTHFIRSSEDKMEDIKQFKHFFDEKDNFLLIMHNDFGGGVGFIFAIDEDYPIDSVADVNDNSYTYICAKIISKEEAKRLYEDESFKSFYKHFSN